MVTEMSNEEFLECRIAVLIWRRRMRATEQEGVCPAWNGTGSRGAESQRSISLLKVKKKSSSFINGYSFDKILNFYLL